MHTKTTSPKVLKQIAYAEIIKLSVLDNSAKEVMQAKPYEAQELDQSVVNKIKQAREKREGLTDANE